jgi:hypothetical protein
MPTFAQGSRSSLSYVTEVTFGTTPAGNFQNLPFSTHSLNLTKMIGSNMTLGAVQKTQDAASGNAPFDSYSGDLAIGTAGSTPSASAIVTALDFTLNNSFAPTFVIGDSFAPSLEYGRAEIEGSFTAYFENDALINRFLNETETALEVSVDDPYTFLFPRIKINSADVGVDGPTSRMISCSFVALYDTTATATGTNLLITRTA